MFLQVCQVAAQGAKSDVYDCLVAVGYRLAVTVVGRLLVLTAEVAAYAHS